MEVDMQSIPFSQARAHLAETLDKLETVDEPVMISRRGQATGVLMSLQQFRQLSAPVTSFTARLNQWRSEHLADLQDEPNPFDSVRDRSAGRDFTW
jgi:prevent-host-death family protein